MYKTLYIFNRYPIFDLNDGANINAKLTNTNYYGEYYIILSVKGNSTDL